MQIRRRDFLRYCLTSAAALGLPLDVIGKLEKAYAAGGGTLPKVVWLTGANCSGCTVSLANRIGTSAPADLADLLINHISLEFHPTLMGAAGDSAVQALKSAAAGPFILVVEGGIPTAFGGGSCLVWHEAGREVTALEAVKSLAPKASALLSVGSCASFGGIPAATPNPTAVRSVRDITGLPAVNITGCPPHPDWIVSVIAQLLVGQTPQLDAVGRPLSAFPGEVNIIHKSCPRKGTTPADNFAQEGRCVKSLGCKGPKTQADCHKRKWNNGTEWCIGANAVCIGCTEPGFPDAFVPFYKSSFSSATAPSLEITLAEWRSATSELVIEGKGTPGQIVKVTAVDNGTLLGSPVADGSGNWRLVVLKPLFVPRQIQAESGAVQVVKDVTTVGATQPAPSGTLSVTKAEWSKSRVELKVEGKADPGKIVSIYNADSGALLGAANADGGGGWRLIRKGGSAPRRVTAKSGGYSASRDVTVRA